MDQAGSAGPTTFLQASAASAGRAPTTPPCQAAAVPCHCGACRQPPLLPHHCCCQAACAPARRWPMRCRVLLRGGPPPPLWEGKGGGKDEKSRAALGGRKLGQCAHIAQWPAGWLLRQAQQRCWVAASTGAAAVLGGCLHRRSSGAGGTHTRHTRGWPAGSLTFPRWRSLGHRWEVKQLPGV